MTTWAKLYLNFWKHPKIERLNSDTERLAYLIAIVEQKDNEDESFVNRDHLRRCLGPYGSCVDALVRAGLIDEFDDGTLAVHNYDMRQGALDPTAIERSRRYRERQQVLLRRARRMESEKRSKKTSQQVDKPVETTRDSRVSDAVTNAVRDDRDSRVTRHGQNRAESEQSQSSGTEEGLGERSSSKKPNGEVGLKKGTPEAREKPTNLKPEAVEARRRREAIQDFTQGFGKEGAR